MSTSAAKPKLHGMPISDTAIKQPVLVVMMVLLVVVAGLLSYNALPVNYFPDITIATTSVTITYSGANPQTMADQVAKPVEDALTTISGVKHITSTSNEGRTQITVEFNDNVAKEQALQDVRDKVNATLPRLPSAVDSPTFQQFDPSQSPVLQLAISSDGSLSSLELRRLIDDVFVPDLQRVNNVGSVDANGGQVRQINVYLNLDRLTALHLAPAQISSAIRNANTNLGLGNIKANGQNINLRAPTQIVQPADIASIPISGTNYRVSDVATVEDGAAEPTSYARLDGQDAVTIAVSKQSGANTAAVAEGAKAELNQLFAANPHLKYVITNDQSTQVRSSIESSIEEIILAVIAAMLVVLLFFRDIRNTLVTVAGLPVILIGTFIAYQIFGLTINIVSLLALSLAVGLVIDDAIVVRENIFRHLERGEDPYTAASQGTAQVATSVLAMTLTIIAVFLPVALVGGITGAIFKGFGITVASAMAISLVEAFTFAPMLSAHLFRQRAPQIGTSGQPLTQNGPADDDAEAELMREAQEVEAEGGEMGRLERGYEGVLRWSLHHRWVPVIATIVILSISIFFALGLKLQFIPAQESDTFGLGFQMPPGTALDTTDKVARQAEAIIRSDPDVVALQTVVGGNGGDENGTFTIRVRNSNLTNAVRDRVRPKLNFLPKLALSTQGFQGGTNTSVTSRNVQIQIDSVRPVSDLVPIADKVQQVMQSTPGFTDIGSSYTQGRPEIDFRVDEAKSGQLGLTNNDLATSVRALVNGDKATTWQQNGDDVDVVVRLPPGQRADISTISTLSLPTSAGSLPLTSIATVTTATGPTSIRRYDRQNEIVIGANVAQGYNQNQVQQELRPKLNQLGLPSDVHISFGGQTQNQNEGFNALFGAMGLAVLFVYMVLASQFGSFTQPLVIMLAMPFSFLGAFVSLRLANLPLDVTGMIGLILLLGLVVKNSILLVDFTNRMRRAGVEKNKALELAGAIRLRPILMTSTTVIAGAIPTALGLQIFGSGEGGSFRRGLAIVTIGGMLTSTLLTLLIVPTAYSLLISIEQRVGGLFRRRPRQPRPVLVPAKAATGTGDPQIYDTDGSSNDGPQFTSRAKSERDAEQVTNTHQDT